MRLVQQTKHSLGKAWVHIEPWSPEPCRAVEAQSRVGRAVGKAKEEVGETRQQQKRATMCCQQCVTLCSKIQHWATVCNDDVQHYVTMYYIVQQLNRVCMRGNWMSVSPVHN